MLYIIYGGTVPFGAPVDDVQSIPHLLTIDMPTSNFIITGSPSLDGNDFNDDGRKDLLLGLSDGRAQVRLNVGTDAAPAFAGPVAPKAVSFIKTSSSSSLGSDPWRTARRASPSRSMRS